VPSRYNKPKEEPKIEVKDKEPEKEEPEKEEPEKKRT